MTDEEELRRARQAEQVLQNPLVSDAIKAMESELYEAWLTTPARDEAGRDWIWRQAVVTRKFKDIFKGMMEGGKIADFRIKEKESLKERALRAVGMR